MINKEQIAKDAEVITDGFAFIQFEEGIRIYDLNNGYGVAVIGNDGIVP